jgi:MYXO-CTERM domain-containing protein
MRNLMLEALAVWLAFAAVSGQACAAIQTGANSVSTMASRGYGVSIADDTDVAVSLLNVAENGSIPANADVALLTWAATDRSGTRTRLTTGVQIKAIQTVQDGGSDAAKFDLIADAKPVTRATVAVPEPGSWATALAGLLGVVAIARRRMSL